MPKRTHGHSPAHARSGTYNAWRNMRQRCRNPEHPQYPNYGARGITVCDRWSSFETFLADMGERPQGLTLERINNDGNYAPDNCVWDTNGVQQRNKRTTHLLTFDGRTLCLKDWAREAGINYSTLRKRITRSGWSVERALTRSSPS
jgi:hypothetical protein